MRLAPTVFVICLLAATAMAFAVTENLKLDESSPISRTRITALFSPVCQAACPASGRSALIGFGLRREEDIRLDIVDASGNVVRRSLVSQVLPAVFREFAWDGRDASGKVVADGVYRANITLADEGRTITFPDEIRVDSTRPTVDDVKVKHEVFSPDGDGRADHASLLYRFSEPAYPVLYVDGHVLPHGRNRRPVAAYQWYGKGLRPGIHRLALAAQDLAGNLGASTREFPVQIRYVALRRRYRALAGHRLRVWVSTDATELRYVLAGPGQRIASRVRATGAIHAFVLRVPTTPGRYRLTVTVHGRSARAPVLVRLR